MASRADQLASNLNFSKFGQATELKNRIWFTIGALIVFRFLSFVPLPGVDPVALSRLYSQTASGGVLDIFNTFSGGSLERMSLIAELPECIAELGGFWTAAGGVSPREPVRREPLPGRNDPCPCGSGKKYKKCHGAPERLN